MVQLTSVEALFETLAALERNARLTTQLLQILFAEIEEIKARLDHLERGF